MPVFIFSGRWAEPTLGDAGFNIQRNGTYTYNKNTPFLPIAPGNPPPAVTFKGKVSEQMGGPGLTKFQWCFVQSVYGTRTIQWDFDRVEWDATSAKGVFTGVPTFIKAPDIPKADNVVDAKDSSYDSQAYAKKVFPLGSNDDGQVQDTPDYPYKDKRPHTSSDGKAISIYFLPKAACKDDLTFTVFLTAYNTETKQFVPLRQRQWTLTWDTGALPKSAEWIPVILAEAGTLTKLPNVNFAISEDYKSKKVKYGEVKVITKP